MRRAPRRACARRASWARSIAPSSTVWSRAASMRRARRSMSRAHELFWICCDTRWSDAADHSHHRRRPCRPRGRGRSDRARRTRRGARGHPFRRRPLPLLSRCRDRHDDRQRQPSAAVGQFLGARLSAHTWRGASAGRTARAEFPFIDLESREEWTLRINDGRVPWWIFSAARRVPGTHALDYLPIGRAAVGRA